MGTSDRCARHHARRCLTERSRLVLVRRASAAKIQEPPMNAPWHTPGTNQGCEGSTPRSRSLFLRLRLIHPNLSVSIDTYAGQLEIRVRLTNECPVAFSFWQMGFGGGDGGQWGSHLSDLQIRADETDRPRQNRNLAAMLTAGRWPELAPCCQSPPRLALPVPHSSGQVTIWDPFRGSGDAPSTLRLTWRPSSLFLYLNFNLTIRRRIRAGSPALAYSVDLPPQLCPTLPPGWANFTNRLACRTACPPYNHFLQVQPRMDAAQRRRSFF